MFGKLSTGVVSVVLALALAPPGEARAQSLFNGGFEIYTPGPNGNGDLVYSPVAGWSSPPIDAAGSRTGNLLYTPGSGDTTGSFYLNVDGGSAYFTLWGPNNGSNNGLPATSPAGGNYVALDGDPFFNGAITATVTGLTVGQPYQVGFYWAGAQFSFASGPTTEQLQVGFGNQTQFTQVLDNPSAGFTAWRYETMNFTANAASVALSFLSLGSPSGLPPVALLDGVSVTAVPEPSVPLLLAAGLVGVGLARRFRGGARHASS